MKRISIFEEIKSIINDSEQIKTATDYDETLKWYSIGDSSLRQQKRMDFVHKAEDIFLKQNKKQILKLASKLCLESIGDKTEIKNLLNNI